MKPIPILIFGTVMIVVFVFLLTSRKSDEIQQTQQTPVSTPINQEDKPAKVTFTETGVLTNFDASVGRETDTWSLVYEEPGSPAMKKELIFTSQSRCDGQPCEMKSFETGQRVTIEGIELGSRIEVVRVESSQIN